MLAVKLSSPSFLRTFLIKKQKVLTFAICIHSDLIKDKHITRNVRINSLANTVKKIQRLDRSQNASNKFNRERVNNPLQNPGTTIMYYQKLFILSAFDRRVRNMIQNNISE